MKVNPENGAEAGISANDKVTPGEISFFSPMRTFRSPEQLAANGIFIGAEFMKATFGADAHDRYLKAVKAQGVVTTSVVPVEGPKI